MLCKMKQIPLAQFKTEKQIIKWDLCIHLFGCEALPDRPHHCKIHRTLALCQAPVVDQW